MPRLMLVRHGLTEWNSQGRIQGHTETRLSDVGIRQAEALAVRLASEPLDAVYASDLGRAVITAETIARPHGLPVQREPRLREADYGAWEGFTMDDLRRQDPERASAWLSEPVAVAPPGGETLEQVADRVASLLDDLRSRPDDEQVLLVGHGGSVRALLCVALHVPQGYSRCFRVDTASLTILQMTPRRTLLTLFNDRHHLSDNGSGDLFIGL
jgi:broad specificity phosphatase PhoE